MIQHQVRDFLCSLMGGFDYATLLANLSSAQSLLRLAMLLLRVHHGQRAACISPSLYVRSLKHIALN